MSDEADMERPVTRRELKEELGNLEARFGTKLERLDLKIDTLGGAVIARMDAMRAELIIEMGRQWKSAMDAAELSLEMARETKSAMDATRAELSADMARHTKAAMDSMRTELSSDMARHTKAAMEWALEQFRTVDDKYTDLPRRVTRLEGKVFPPKRARRR